MTISVGETVPMTKALIMGENGPEEVDFGAKFPGRKVVVFGLPAAFSGTCTSAHIPSYMRTRDAFAEKGVDEIICVAVNDPFVMAAWDEATGASAGGITMLGDAASEFTKGIGMNFTAPPVGFYDRSKRYSMLVEDGVVKVLHVEESPGVCETSAGETLLAEL